MKDDQKSTKNFHNCNCANIKNSDNPNSYLKSQTNEDRSGKFGFLNLKNTNYVWRYDGNDG